MGSVSRLARSRATRRRSARRGRGEAIPLSQLRVALGPGRSPAVVWRQEAEIGGRVMPTAEMPAGGRLDFALSAVEGARVSVSAGLPPLEWSERSGGLRFTLSLVDDAGRTLLAASTHLGTATSVDRWRWRRLALVLDTPAPRVTLRLALDGADGQRPVRLGWWGGGELALPPAAIARTREEAVGALPEAPAQHRAAKAPHVSAPVGAPIPVRPGARTEAPPPAVSVLMPVYDPEPVYLAEAIDSVQRQDFEDWELCVIDDGSRDAEVRALLDERAASDARVRLGRHPHAQGIAAATNAALALATSDYVALLDHDDLLVDDALAAVADAFRANPDVDMAYSDEELCDAAGASLTAYRKPGWSPELLESLMYTCHLGVYRRGLVESLGGFRSDFEGSQDYDLALRAMDHGASVLHIPRVLYRWRVHPGSAAADTQAKPYAYRAARRALGEHLGRRGIPGVVEWGDERGEYRIVRDPPADAQVAVLLVLPDMPLAASASDLAEFARTLLEGTHGGWELVVGAAEPALRRAVRILWGAGVGPGRLHAVACDAIESKPARFNRLAQACAAEYVLLVDGPVHAKARDWLGSLVGLAVEPQIAAVGAKIITADERIEHAGVVLDDGVPQGVLQAAPVSFPGHLGNARVIANFVAVSGVMLTRRTVFERLKGLDDRMDGLADVDYCLRAGAAGLRVVSAPTATLRRPPGAGPVVTDLRALTAFRARWRAARDPYFNPGFWRGRADFQPRQ